MKEGRSEGVREVECGIPGQGMFWEADECARCVRDVSWSFFPLFIPSAHMMPFAFETKFMLCNYPTLCV